MTKTVKEIKEILHKVSYCAPVVKLETLPDAVWNKHLLKRNVNMRVNKEPNHKKIKTVDNTVQIPKLIIPNKKETIKSNKKHSNDLDNNQNKKSSVSSHVTNTKCGVTSSKNIIKRKANMSKQNIKKKVAAKKSLINKIKINDVQTINYNYDLTNKQSFFFVDSKTKTSGVVQFKTSSIDLRLDVNRSTLTHFYYIYEKYFNESVQNSIIIANNIVFINYLTCMHVISRTNCLLRMKDKNAMKQSIYNQSVICIKYVNLFDQIIKQNCIKVISLFEDADYEHGLLIFLLSLFTNLKIIGGNLFKNGNVVLQKLQQLSWENETKNNFDHNKIIRTLKSKTFCSYFHKLAAYISENSTLEPEFIKFWQLFCIPSVFKNLFYFRSSIDAIINFVDINEIVNLLNNASNSVHSHFPGKKELKALQYEELISFIRNKTENNDISNEIIQPSTSGLSSLNITNPFLQIQDKTSTSAPDVFPGTSKTSNLNKLQNAVPNRNFIKKVTEDFTTSTNIPGTSNSIQLQDSQLCKSSHLFEERQIFNFIINKNSPYVFLTKEFRNKELNLLKMIFPNTIFTCEYLPENSNTNNLNIAQGTSSSVSSKHNSLNSTIKKINKSNIH